MYPNISLYHEVFAFKDSDKGISKIHKNFYLVAYLN